jgi:Serine dehydrogenase proteinase
MEKERKPPRQRPTPHSERARGLGLPVSEAMPKEVYTLMALYPQPTQWRPSVEYVPIPYERQRQPRPGREIRS